MTMEKYFVRTEIGSEFWDVPVKETEENLFPADTRWFVCGTGALQHIIGDIQESIDLKKVGVPSWCCSCMIEPFVKAGITVVFYPVYVDGERRLACDYTVTADCDATLILTYFGYDRLNANGTPGGILIRDLTHSLFCREYADAQYYFGSLRKWAGFWTGGYAWKKGCWNLPQPVQPADTGFLRLRQEAMSMKLAYLKGATDKKDYLDIFEDAEDYLDCCGVEQGCDRDIQCARKLDTAHIRARRTENAKVLLESLKDMALFPEIGEHDCPMFVPILLPDRQFRDELRRHLISKEIYCPVHWPVSELHGLGEKESGLYDRSLSIVCDQRYDTLDMIRIADVIKAFGGWNVRHLL